MPYPVAQKTMIIAVVEVHGEMEMALFTICKQSTIAKLDSLLPNQMQMLFGMGVSRYPEEKVSETVNPYLSVMLDFVMLLVNLEVAQP